VVFVVYEHVATEVAGYHLTDLPMLSAPAVTFN
jgi:hypothetical protein